jgi:hypothetical protein
VGLIRDRAFQVWRVPLGNALNLLLQDCGEALVCKEGRRGRATIVRER